MKYLITVLLGFGFTLQVFAQSWTTINSINKLNYSILNTYLNKDTLFVYGKTSNLTSNVFYNQYEIQRFANKNVTLIDSTIIDTNLVNFTNFIIPYQNTFLKFGTVADTSKQEYRLYYNMGNLDDFSNKVYIDTPYSQIGILFVKKINENYFLSLSKIDIANKSTMVLLELDSNLNIVNRLESECLGSPCLLLDLIWNKRANTFTGLSSDVFRDSVSQSNLYGNGITTIDSNLNIIPGSNRLMEINGTFHITLGSSVGTFMGALAPISDSTFMVMSGVFNPYYIFNPKTNPNPARDWDLAIGIREIDAPYNEQGGVSKIYGKNDTAEYGSGGTQQILKYDSNLYVTALTERFYLVDPMPWNTDAVIYGLNEKGDLHWSYYLPFDDYCYVRRMEKDDKGGLWVTGQCTEYDNNNNLHSFAKVTYIDSIAYWPRKSTPVGINEPIKKAEEIKVFPNPTKDYFTVRQYYRPVQLHFTLLDQMGRLVQEQNSNYSDTQIDVSSLKSGVYFLRITDTRGNLISTEKIVKSN